MILILIDFMSVRNINKILEEIRGELINIHVILSFLYLIKVKWKNEINNPQIKERLSQFYLPVETYKNLLFGLMNELESKSKT